jgi:hypothetical protein
VSGYGGVYGYNRMGRYNGVDRYDQVDPLFTGQLLAAKINLSEDCEFF